MSTFRISSPDDPGRAKRVVPRRLHDFTSITVNDDDSLTVVADELPEFPRMTVEELPE